MLRSKFINAVFMLSVLVAGATMIFAQRGPGGGPGGQGGSQGQQRDPLSALKRAITQANAPTLTAQQETALTALITAYRDALPDDEDAALEAAHDAFDAALLAGNLTAAQTQATAIATRQAQLSDARLKLFAKFVIDVLANLKAGGQYDPLVTQFGADRTLQLAKSLAGGGRR